MCRATLRFPVSTKLPAGVNPKNGNSVQTWPFVKSLAITLRWMRRVDLTALCWQSKATTKNLLSYQCIVSESGNVVSHGAIEATLFIVGLLLS